MGDPSIFPLAWSGRYLFTTHGTADLPLHVITPDGGAQYALEGDSLHCITDTDVAVLERTGTGQRRALIAHDLGSGAERMLAEVPVSKFRRTCVSHGNQVAIQHDRASSVDVFDVATGERQTYDKREQIDQLLGFDGQSLTQLDWDRVGTAPLAEEAALKWRWLRRVSWHNAYGLVSVRGDDATWARESETHRKYSVIMRGSIRDNTPTRVLAEMSARTSSGGFGEPTAIGATWLAYGAMYANEIVHFVPIDRAD